MPVPQIVKTRLTQMVNRGTTPDDIERFLFTNNIFGIPDSDTDGILQRYLRSLGIATDAQIARGIKYITTDDNDSFIMPRALAVFLVLFNRRKYPRIIDPSDTQD